MDELANLLKEIVKDTHQQDIELLNLSKAIIERLLEMERVIDKMQQGMLIQHETIKIHTDTLKSVREIVEMIASKDEEIH